MKKEPILLTPGPTPIPESVRRRMAEPILHHRTKEFGVLFAEVLEGLKYVYRTRQTVLVACGSGTAGMEAAVANVCSPGDKVFVASFGVFGNRWAKILKAYGLEPIVYEVEWGQVTDPAEFKKRLEAAGKDVKAVFLSHTDTSTGGAPDIKQLASIVRSHSDALVVVDSVSGLGAQPLETDAWGLDVVVSASQKGLMNAPGLAFFAVSDRSWKAVEAGKLPRFYWDWRTSKASLANRETPYTPAVTLLAGQAEALRLIKEEGIEQVWARTHKLAEHTRSAFKAMGLKAFAHTPAEILTAVWLPEGVNGEELVNRIRDHHGISIAGGQEKLKGKILRLAHMGAITLSEVDQGLAALRQELAAAPAGR